MAGAVGLIGTGALPSAAAQTTARTETVGDAVFLGGDFMELGIRGDGGFGPSMDAPTSFYGSDRGEIGMYADLDGFANEEDPQFRYDYFLPGSPEERWSIGYRFEGSDFTASNGRNPGETIPTTVTATSSGETLAAEVESTFNDMLLIEQTYSFDRPDRFFSIHVNLTNVGDETIDDVRYQRSVDPDNGVDTGCEYVTKNTIVNQPPTSEVALVKAEIHDGDTCDLADYSSAPFFYYSPMGTARVSSGSSSTGLVPSPVVYAPEDYENAPSEGTQDTADTYVAITVDVGALEPGESTLLTVNPGMTDDIDETVRDISEASDDAGCIERRYRSRDTEQDSRCDIDFSEADRNRSRADGGRAGGRDLVDHTSRRRRGR